MICADIYWKYIGWALSLSTVARNGVEARQPSRAVKRLV